MIAYTTQRKLIQVFPNHYSAGQFVQPGRQHSVPSDRMDFDLKVTGPAGTETMIALVSNMPFNLLGSSFNESTPFLILDLQESSTYSAVLEKIDSLQGQKFSQRQATYTIE